MSIDALPDLQKLSQRAVRAWEAVEPLVLAMAEEAYIDTHPPGHPLHQSVHWVAFIRLRYVVAYLSLGPIKHGQRARRCKEFNVGTTGMWKWLACFTSAGPRYLIDPDAAADPSLMMGYGRLPKPGKN